MVAPPHVVRTARKGRLIHPNPADKVGSGGEGSIYGIRGYDQYVLKLYHQPPGPERRDKIEAMIRQRIDLYAPGRKVPLASWPLDLVKDPTTDHVVGFTMPRVQGALLAYQYLHAHSWTRHPVTARLDYVALHAIAHNISLAVQRVHDQSGNLIGDLNASNVLVHPDGMVTLIDCDSYEVRDIGGGRIYTCDVGTGEYTPPELIGKDLTGVRRRPEHDRFALAALLFLILNLGSHAFRCRAEGDRPNRIPDNILAGLFPWGPFRKAEPASGALPFEIMEPTLQALFIRAFALGHRDPSARPRPEEWREALQPLTKAPYHQTCGLNPRHKYPPHLTGCPWCERKATLGRDPFPPPPGQARPSSTTKPPVKQPSGLARAPNHPGAPQAFGSHATGFRRSPSGQTVGPSARAHSSFGAQPAAGPSPNPPAIAVSPPTSPRTQRVGVSSPPTQPVTPTVAQRAWAGLRYVAGIPVAVALDVWEAVAWVLGGLWAMVRGIVSFLFMAVICVLAFVLFVALGAALGGVVAGIGTATVAGLVHGIWYLVGNPSLDLLDSVMIGAVIGGVSGALLGGVAGGRALFESG